MADDGLKEPVIIQATRIDATLLPRNIFSQPYLLYVIQQGTDLGNVAGKANEAGQGAWDAQKKNDEQDLVLANHESRITAAEVTLVNHEQRLTAAEATLVNHETRITAAEAELADHETRITANEAELANHETRITQNTTDIAGLTVRMVTAESNITSLQTNVTSLTTRVTTAEGNITTLQGKVSTIETNYVSKAVSTSQSVQASGGSFLVGNIATPTTDKLQVGGSVNAVSYKVAGIQVVGAQRTGWTAATGTAYRGAFDANQAWTIGILDIVQIQQIANSLTQARQRIKALEDDLRAHGLIN
ncbi:chromosome segregation protein SMC [Serratia marcescens]|uniref:phage tail protein n=1 Tax=Serratia marcescens TaxID=615 RepID=UPI001F157025|nr:phage tail protein [Serratia marcescens]CAI1596477.1 chromosome segregation protein SMC [Serratia marcescens]CAI1601340.1 chromosome segregation protein SMC [Serratia marcescens]CAI1607026.1 chromosome segregation protein SMC [Serratia marcescens]CAI1971381.1 chromosome segregation protein SMC [Serratia marcescens]CAI2025240.1 chromosome segregation protein SMC [Serratia marcescens]